VALLIARKGVEKLIVQNVKRGSTVYTDCHIGYKSLKGYDHKAVTHSVGEYVKGKAHTCGIDSFWALLKRGYYGVFHHMSRKHLHRYVKEFAARYNLGHGTMFSINAVLDGMIDKRLTYKRLKA